MSEILDAVLVGICGSVIAAAIILPVCDWLCRAKEPKA
jgi:hypothetical protein